MKLVPASDSALLVEFGNEISFETHQQVISLLHALQTENDPRIRNLHPAYGSLLIDFDCLRLSHEGLAARVKMLLNAASDPKDGTSRGREGGEAIEIPVSYDAEFGPDLPDVAEFAGISPDEVVRLHSSPTYLVYFLGFTPGYAYLGGLPERLHMPRLSTPRIRVAAGTVAIGGSQTGVYPVDSPGGWRLIGRTPLPMLDPSATPPTRLQPGDRVRFAPIDRRTFDAISSSSRVGAEPASARVEDPGKHATAVSIRVLKPGLSSTVQDLGRFGYAHLGISPAGAADRLSFRIGNLLVGNGQNAAALEMTLLGASLEFDSAAVVALTGAACQCRLNGHPVPQYEAIDVPAGAVLQCGAITGGARAYVAIRGGFDVPLLMGSASTDVAGRFGGIEGRRLSKGDLLAARSGPTRWPKAVRHPQVLKPGALDRFFAPGPIRITRGAQQEWFGAEEFQKFLACTYTVSEQSDRAGLRLKGEALLPRPGGQLITDGIPLGAVQVPPDGQPIILFVDQQTTGGYPKLANVIAADMHRVGQLRPRDLVRFAEVSMAEAIDSLRTQEEWLRQTFAY